MATPLLRRLAAHQLQQPPISPDPNQRPPRQTDASPPPPPLSSVHPPRPRSGSISRPLPPVPVPRERPLPPSAPSIHYPFPPPDLFPAPSRPWPPPPEPPPPRAKPLPMPPPPAPRPMSIDSSPVVLHSTTPATADSLPSRRSSVGGPRPAPDSALARRAARARLTGGAPTLAATHERPEPSTVPGTEEPVGVPTMAASEEPAGVPAMVVTAEPGPSVPTMVVTEDRPNVPAMVVTEEPRPGVPTMVIPDERPSVPTMMITEERPSVPAMVVTEEPGPSVPTMVVTEERPNVSPMVVPPDPPLVPSASPSPIRPTRATRPMTTKATPMGPPTCAGCRQLIAGRFVHALDQHWHPACFRCNHCGLDLEHVAFYEHEGLAYCGVDFDELFSLKCHHCNTSITDESYVTLDDPSLPNGPRHYHQLHLFCAECGNPFVDPKSLEERSRISLNPSLRDQNIDQVTTVVEPKPFVIHQGYPYCEQCDHKLHLPKCFGCKKPVVGTFLKAMGKVWHEDCFVCMICKDQFINDKFFLIDHHRHLHQGQDFNELEIDQVAGRNKKKKINDGGGGQIAVCEKCY